MACRPRRDVLVDFDVVVDDDEQQLDVHIEHVDDVDVHQHQQLVDLHDEQQHDVDVNLDEHEHVDDGVDEHEQLDVLVGFDVLLHDEQQQLDVHVEHVDEHQHQHVEHAAAMRQH